MARKEDPQMHDVQFRQPTAPMKLWPMWSRYTTAGVDPELGDLKTLLDPKKRAKRLAELCFYRRITNWCVLGWTVLFFGLVLAIIFTPVGGPQGQGTMFSFLMCTMVFVHGSSSLTTEIRLIKFAEYMDHRAAEPKTASPDEQTQPSTP
jgi:hypothetical protein